MLELPNCNGEWRTRAFFLAKWGKLDLPVKVDQTFDAIYADRDHTEDWQEGEKRRYAKLRK